MSESRRLACGHDRSMASAIGKLEGKPCLACEYESREEPGNVRTIAALKGRLAEYDRKCVECGAGLLPHCPKCDPI